jgi:hypothetical protein
MGALRWRRKPQTHKLFVNAEGLVDGTEGPAGSGGGHRWGLGAGLHARAAQPNERGVVARLVEVLDA